MTPNPLLRSARKRAKDVLGLVLLGLTGCGLIAAIAAAMVLAPVPLDAETLCPQRAPPAAMTLILVDASGPLEPRLRARLRAAILEEAMRLPRLALLDIKGMRPNAPREFVEVFSRCNPGDSGSANPLFSNPARIQARWKIQFADPLKAAAARASNARQAAMTSPILDAVAGASQDLAFANFTGPRRLVLITDLLEHDPEWGFSAYADGADLGRFLARRTGYEVPDLAGITVRVIVLDRPDLLHRQTAARDGLWRPFFERAGADEVRFEGL